MSQQRRVRSGPVYLSEVRFTDKVPRNHLINRDNVTEKTYEIYTNDDTFPGWVVFIDRDTGTTYGVPISAVASVQVSERSLTQHQPVGTRDLYDTPSGQKRRYHQKKQSSEKPMSEQ